MLGVYRNQEPDAIDIGYNAFSTPPLAQKKRKKVKMHTSRTNLVGPAVFSIVKLLPTIGSQGYSAVPKQ